MNRLVLALAIVPLVLGSVPFASAALVTVPLPGAPDVDTDLPFVKHVFPTIEKRFAGSGNQATPNMQYHEGAVHHTPHVYLVFWGWQGPNNPVTDPNGEGAIITAFFSGIGGSAWAGVQTQFADRTAAIANPASQLAGVWYDDDLVNGFPVQPDLFIGDEALRAADHFGYDPEGNYMILTPHLHNDAQFGLLYCAWHSWQPDALGRTVAFSDIPYMPDGSTGCPGDFVNAGSTTDAITIVAGHEYAEAVTDPHGDGWYDTNGAGENGDKCNWNAGPGADAQNIVLPTGTFPVQALWSNIGSTCAMSYAGAPGAALDPSSGTGGGDPVPTPPPYHESGSVTVMTSQAVFVGTQHENLGQGTTTWMLDPAQIASHAGFRFWLNATGTGAGVNDFDVYFYDAGGSSVGNVGAAFGDEADIMPAAAKQAFVILSAGAPGTFDFDAE